jgi:hypothetical protein
MDESLAGSFPGLADMESNFKNLVVFKEGSDILNSFKQSTFPRSPYYSYDAYYKITKKNHKVSVG